MRKNIGLLLGVYGMLSAMEGASKPYFANTKGDNDGSYGHGMPDKPKKVIPAGCKEYTFSGITVIASSEKSARKKIQKKLDKQKMGNV